MRPRYRRWRRRYRGKHATGYSTNRTAHFPPFEESAELKQLRVRLGALNDDLSSRAAARAFYVRVVATALWIYLIFLFVTNARKGPNFLQSLIPAAILWWFCREIVDGAVSLIFRVCGLHSSQEEKMATHQRISSTVEMTYRQERDEWERQIAKMKEMAELEDRVRREKARERALKLDTLNPFEFERMVAEKFEQKGYAVRLTNKSSDGGIDVWLSEGTKKVAVQCKRYAQDNGVSRPDIQKFIGAMITEGADEGIFISTSYFTDGATKAALSSPRRIVLIDRAATFTLLDVSD